MKSKQVQWVGKSLCLVWGQAESEPIFGYRTGSVNICILTGTSCIEPSVWWMCLYWDFGCASTVPPNTLFGYKHTLSLMFSCCLPHKPLCSSFSRRFWGTQRDRQGKVKGSNHGVRGVVNSPLVRVWHAWFVEGGDRVDWSPGMGLAWVCFCMSKQC